MPTEEATSGGGRGGDSDGSDDSGGGSRSKNRKGNYMGLHINPTRMNLPS
jgi:hypothetical protein